MKKRHFIAGIVIGFIITLIILGSNDKCSGEGLNESYYDSKINDLLSDITVLETTETRFIANLFLQEDKGAYLSHFDQCLIKDQANERDACIMSFIFDVEDYSACFLLSDVNMKRSCLNLESD